MKRIFGFLVISVFVAVSAVQAQKAAANKTSADSVEENLDAMFLDNKDNKNTATESALVAGVAKWDFFGYVESENVMAVSGKTAVKNKEIAKTEIRTRLNFRYGTPFFYATGMIDVFFYPLAPVYMNPYTNSNLAAKAKEIYVGGGEKFQFKLGKIAYNWGEADAFRITNFLDKSDSSEIFFKDEDERYTGIYSLLMKYVFGAYALEMVVTPDFLIPELPKAGGFWSMNMPNVPFTSPIPPSYPILSMPVEFQNPPSIFSSLSYKNISAAIRIGGSAKAIDFHFSYLNGFHNAMVVIPQVFLDMASLVGTGKVGSSKVVLSPLYERVNKIGFDLAGVHKRFSARFETVLTPDYVAMYKDATKVDSNGRRQTVRVPYWAFTIGADYGWRDYGRIAVEYTTGFFLKNYNLYEKEFFSDFLLLTIEDRVAKNRLLLRVGVLLHTTTKKPGVMPLAHIEYFFDNGLSLAFGTNIFIGQDDTLLSLYDANDLIYLKARYNF